MSALNFNWRVSSIIFVSFLLTVVLLLLVVVGILILIGVVVVSSVYLRGVFLPMSMSVTMTMPMMMCVCTAFSQSDLPGGQLLLLLLAEGLRLLSLEFFLAESFFLLDAASLLHFHADDLVLLGFGPETRV